MPSAGTATSVAELNLLGGDPALDFANTIEWRDGRDPLDLLRTPGDLVAWASRAGLPIGPVRASGDLDEAIALREHVHDAFSAIARAEQPDATDVEAIAHAASAALRAATLTPTDGAWLPRWPGAGVEAVGHAVALAALALLADTERLALVRRCDGDSCGWLFVDASRNHRRRWCSMAGCGSRAKMRRAYARRRVAG